MADVAEAAPAPAVPGPVRAVKVAPLIHSMLVLVLVWCGLVGAFVCGVGVSVWLGGRADTDPLSLSFLVLSFPEGRGWGPCAAVNAGEWLDSVAWQAFLRPQRPTNLGDEGVELAVGHLELAGLERLV